MREEEDGEDGDRLSPHVAEEDESQPDPRKRWWRRRAEDEEEQAPAQPASDTPRHVRVLSPEDGDPWEQGFDAPVTAEAEEVDEDTSEQIVEQSGRRLRDVAELLSRQLEREQRPQRVPVGAARSNREGVR